MLPRKNKLLIALSLLFLLFLFIGSPGDISTRSLKHAWNVGHTLIFFVWTTLLLRMGETYDERPSFYKRVLFTLIMVNTMGLFIESAQEMMGRTSDLEDIYKNIVGSLMALAFYTPLKNRVSHQHLNLFRAFVATLFIITLIPFTKSIFDEISSYNRFPLLAGFESALELERWDSYHHIELADEPVSQGDLSLKVGLTTTQYSGISLDYFPRDWSNYALLKMDIFNPSKDIVPSIIRIHDLLHEKRNNDYQDRFNKSFALKKGWNRITIHLREVMLSPKKRSMDMAKIKKLRLFVIKLDKPANIYLDNVRLEN